MERLINGELMERLINRNLIERLHLSHRLCPSTGGCSPPSMPSIERLMLVINSRLSWSLENGAIADHQTGFRQGRPTQDQVMYVPQEIEDALPDQKKTIAA